jgi:hypothetical protein
MAGSTATIDFTTLRMQWQSHSAIAAICTHWTITKDQLIRLKHVCDLPPRHDRRLRFKPLQPASDPTPEAIKQACYEIRMTWDERTEIERRVTKPPQFTMRVFSVDEEDGEWT